MEEGKSTEDTFKEMRAEKHPIVLLLFHQNGSGSFNLSKHRGGAVYTKWHNEHLCFRKSCSVQKKILDSYKKCRGRRVCNCKLSRNYSGQLFAISNKFYLNYGGIIISGKSSSHIESIRKVAHPNYVVSDGRGANFWGGGGLRLIMFDLQAKLPDLQPLFLHISAMRLNAARKITDSEIMGGGGVSKLYVRVRTNQKGENENPISCI